MTITELARAIEAQAVEMRPITVAAGVSEATYAKIMDVDPNLTVEDLENRHAFLIKVWENEYREVLEVWRLLPPAIWQRYTDFGETQLREQKLLKEAQKRLRKVWRKRYGKDQVPEQGVDQGSLA